MKMTATQSNMSSSAIVHLEMRKRENSIDKRLVFRLHKLVSTHLLNKGLYISRPVCVKSNISVFPKPN